nr:MAG TPA: hypothetical protein [Caudoviricetes sp.]
MSRKTQVLTINFMKNTQKQGYILCNLHKLLCESKFCLLLCESSCIIELQ